MIIRIIIIYFFTVSIINDTYAKGIWKPIFHSKETLWADSVIANLTLDERIAQLFMVAAYSNKDQKHKEEISTLIKEYKIGGIMFLQGNPTNQIKLTNHFQSISNTPLMIALDAEWGPAMRLDSLIPFPWQMTLGDLVFFN